MDYIFLQNYWWFLVSLLGCLLYTSTISAWWILVANAWMQYPVGMAFKPETVRNEMEDFAAVALSPMAIDKFFHTAVSYTHLEMKATHSKAG